MIDRNQPTRPNRPRGRLVDIKGIENQIEVSRALFPKSTSISRQYSVKCCSFALNCVSIVVFTGNLSVLIHTLFALLLSKAFPVEINKMGDCSLSFALSRFSVWVGVSTVIIAVCGFDWFARPDAFRFVDQAF